MDGLQKSGKLSKVPLKEAEEGLRLARGAISDPSMFKQMDGFKHLENGADIQRAHMNQLGDTIFTNKYALNTKSNIQGTLTEYSQVGHVLAPDGSSMTTIAPGRCQQTSVMPKCTYDYDQDLIRIRKDANGDIVGAEIIDRKSYSDASDLRDEMAEAAKRHGKSYDEYQKERFTQNYLNPESPENRQQYIDFIRDTTGYSAEDAAKLYDAQRDWARGLHNPPKVTSKYEPILHDGKGGMRQSPHEIGTMQRLFPDETKALMRDKYFGPNSRCAPCKSMTPDQQDAFIQNMFDAQYGVQGITPSLGKSVPDWDRIATGELPPPRDPVSELLDNLYPTSPPNIAALSTSTSVLATEKSLDPRVMAAMIFFSLATLICISTLRGKRVRHG